ncbi:2-hydroxyacid dehydrogenase [Aminiphilus circumscriptus]|uniref:2-hydroxyacid dehydrogenase n=1 Tax=Aminiphilus circumscriptus TaxID=290732 RepID=UPI0004B689C6|nr:D-glycerate dehydrogenase [Aminiphilus circumscriptus]
MKPKVLVTRSIPEAGLALLRERVDLEIGPSEGFMPREVLLAKLPLFDGVLCLLKDRMDREALDAATRLKVLSNYGVGYDNIDVPYATAKGIVVTNTPDVLTEATADMAFALLLAVARRLSEAERIAREGKWAWAPDFLLGADLHGATLGLVGFGRIGKAVARRAKGFGLRIRYTLARPSAEGDELGAVHVPIPEDLLAESDFVSLHVPLVAETRHFMNEERFRRMKPGAIFVNTGRGGLVDQEALARALNEGWIAGAGLDVFDPEPLPAEHPLFRAKNLLPAPHIGSATPNARNGMAVCAATNLLAVLEGRTPPNPVLV